MEDPQPSAHQPPSSENAPLLGGIRSRHPRSYTEEEEEKDDGEDCEPNLTVRKIKTTF